MPALTKVIPALVLVCIAAGAAQAQTSSDTNTVFRTPETVSSDTFGNAALVSSSSLASSVSGVSIGSGGTSASPYQPSTLMVGNGSFQGVNGLLATNMNSGVASSQNAAISVTVAAPTSTLP